MSKSTVSQRDAELVLAAIKKQYAVYLEDAGPDDQPLLIKDWNFFGNGAVPYAVIWEGGPYEWAHLVDGGIEEEFGFRVQAAELPDTVEVEPYTGWALAIYSK